MKIRFWSSTEYSGFLAGLMRELTEAGFDAQQCFNISEQSYRSAKSAPARLFLRFRQYAIYPVQLCFALLWHRIAGVIRPSASEAPSASGSDSGSVGKHSTINDQPSTTNLCDSVAVVSTNTFYAPLIATYLHPNVVHLVYDLFPEAMIHSGKWTEGTLKVKIVRWITKQTLKRSKTNVFLGPRLKDYVESIHGAVANSAIIAVGADQSLFPASPKQRLMCEGAKVQKCESQKAEGREHKPEGSDDASNLDTLPPSYPERKAQLTILYCGNFGNMHDSVTLFEYWRQRESDTPFAFSQDGEKRQECRFYFSCSGPKRAALETERAQLPAALQQQIQLGGGLSQEDWITTMKAADVALVTMVPGSETVVMPSKTYSAMMAGQAILAIAPEDSDLVDLIKAADCGWFVEPGDVVGLAKVIEAICSDSEGVLQKRENAFQYAHAHLGQDALAKDWARALRAEA